MRRGIPQELKSAKMENRGDVKTMSNGPLSATKYQDRKPVNLWSTTEISSIVDTNKRDRDTGVIIRHHQMSPGGCEV